LLPFKLSTWTWVENVAVQCRYMCISWNCGNGKRGEVPGIPRTRSDVPVRYL
jgi:hypothetical protein